MSNPKKRRGHAKDKDDAPSRQTTPALQTSVESSNNPPSRFQLVLLIVAASMWVGWFSFLLYAALRR